MTVNWFVGVLLLLLPCVAAIGLVIFMSSGRGDAATTEELVEHRKSRDDSVEVEKEEQ